MFTCSFTFAPGRPAVKKLQDNLLLPFVRDGERPSCSTADPPPLKRDHPLQESSPGSISAGHLSCRALDSTDLQSSPSPDGTALHKDDLPLRTSAERLAWGDERSRRVYGPPSNPLHVSSLRRQSRVAVSKSGA